MTVPEGGQEVAAAEANRLWEKFMNGALKSV
jgi:hypothetical protein